MLPTQLLHLGPFSERGRWQLSELAPVGRRKMTATLKAKALGDSIHRLRLNSGLGVMAQQRLMHLLQALDAQYLFGTHTQELFASLDQAAA